MSRKSAYVDYQQRATEFSVGDLVFPFMGGNQANVGRVVAVFPAIGMVDVEWPHGSERYPVEELQRYQRKDFIPPSPEHNNVPGGTGTVSVPGGPENLPFEEPSRKATEVLPVKSFAVKVVFSDGNSITYPSIRATSESRAKNSAKRQAQEKKKSIKDIQIVKVWDESKKRLMQAFVKKSLYWAAKDRHYKATQGEIDSGHFNCPKCKEDVLKPASYKRSEGISEKLLCCPTCLFLIKRCDIMGHPDYEEDIDPKQPFARIRLG